jgi:hypothetical protein
MLHDYKQTTCYMHYEKMGWFVTSHAIGFWAAMTICNSFVTQQHECYQTSCKNCNGYNSLYVKPYTYATLAT